MRIDIDEKDVANLFDETERRFSRSHLVYFASLAVLGASALCALIVAQQSIATFAAQKTGGPLAAFVASWGDPQSPIYTALICVGVIGASIWIGRELVRARAQARATRRRDAQNCTLKTGRFEFVIVADGLTVKGAQAIRKISWSTIERIEDAKSSLVFWRRDGGCEFIPKNTLPNDQVTDSILVKHQSKANAPHKFESANQTAPLSLTFETTPADFDELKAHQFRRQQPHFDLLRRIVLWRAWPPIVFMMLLIAAISFGHSAFTTPSLYNAAYALFAISAAAGIFYCKSDFFRGPAYPFRKNATWPYGQSNLNTVRFSKEGVYHSRHGANDFFRWTAVKGIVESHRYAYLIISADIAIVLPKRAFLSKAHFNDFRNYAKANIDLANKALAHRKHDRLMRSIGESEKTMPAKERAQNPVGNKDAAERPPQKKRAPSKNVAPQKQDNAPKAGGKKLRSSKRAAMARIKTGFLSGVI